LPLEEGSKRGHLILILAKSPADWAPFARGEPFQNVEEKKKYPNPSFHGNCGTLESTRRVG